MVNSNQKLSCAICSILGLQVAPAAYAAGAAETGDSSEALGEIIVTAQRREENIQNVPITIQAMTSETIDPAERREFGRRHQVICPT